MNDAYGHRWISEAAEELIVEVGSAGDGALHCDVLIIGSGYGGAVAAARLAGAHREGDASKPPIKVWLLERGNEVLPGMFPATFAELPGHVRFSGGGPARGKRDGVFDMRMAGDMFALVGNGLGGGSLINAAVMERPTADAFTAAHWPEGMNLAMLAPAYQRAEQMLAPQVIEGSVPKLDSLLAAAAEIGAQEARKAQVAITFRDGITPAGVSMSACLRCGDCVTGCNHRAKQSLDVNYLAAARAKGARLFCGATVTRLQPLDGEQQGRGYRVEFVLTDPARAPLDRQRPCHVNARNVVVAAGTFGSTELLLKSASALGLATTALGTRFSGNGDMIAVAHGQNDRAPSSAVESDPPAARRLGPTITGLMRVSVPSEKRPIVIEEFGIPGPLRRLLGEVVATTDALHGLAHTDRSVHLAAEGINDPLAVNDEALGRTPVYGLMGDDGAGGTLKLSAGGLAPEGRLSDGHLRVEWQDKKPLTQLINAGLQALRTAHEHPGGRGGRVLPNPLWQPLPPFGVVEEINLRGPALTVHPLGGCPMGRDREQGMVDRFGRAFAAQGSPDATLPGLAVLDGSIVPGALGINPALTIAALAEHAVPQLAIDWDLVPSETLPPMDWPRPQRRDVTLPGAPSAAVFRLRERMSGALRFGMREVDCTARVTFARFEARRFRRLPRTLALDDVVLEFRSGAGTARARCSGRAEVLHREPSTMRDRVERVRELARARIADFMRRLDSDVQCGPLDLQALCSHLGQVRLIEYHWSVFEADAAAPVAPGDRLTLTKRIEFTEQGNPWRQLSEGELVRHAAHCATPERLGHLALDLGYFAEQMVALIEIESQQDAPNAIGDIAELALWVMRIVLRIHLLNFLPPIDGLGGESGESLAGEIEGAMLSTQTLPVEKSAPDGGPPAVLRLARYVPEGGARGRPVLLIHGYGGAASMFTHASIGTGVAKFLLDAKREVWVIDLRTSIGLNQRRYWQFDDIARGDLSVALAEVLKDKPAGTRVDVVAHCIGAAMFSVAALADGSIAERVGAVVLSQVGPLVRMSPFNRLRGFLASYLQQFLGAEVFDVKQDLSLPVFLLDGLLATFPYPDGDGEAARVAAVGRDFRAVRHRSDAIYGQLMKLPNVGDELLRHLDLINGWVMVKALAQTIHYAREQLLTDAAGMNQLVSVHNIMANFGFPVMLLHGRENAVFDPRGSEDSVRLLARIFGNVNPQDKEAAVPTTGRRRLKMIEGYGHQDCIVGENAHRDVFPHILGFLDEFPDAEPERGQGSKPIVAELPWMGPTLGAASLDETGRALHCRLALRPPPARQSAFAVVYIPARRRSDGRWHLILDDAVAETTDREVLVKDVLQVTLRLDAALQHDGFAVVTMHDDLPFLGTRIINADKAAPGLFAKPAQAPEQAIVDQLQRWLPTLDAAALDRAIVELHPGWIAAAEGQPAQERLTLALASCQYPAGIVDRQPAEQTYTRLARRLADEPAARRPQMLLLLGDQVYVDDLAGLFNPTGGDHIERAYRTNLTLDAFKRVGKALPVLPVIDDHEIADDWAEGHTGKSYRDQALRAWRQFQHKLTNAQDVRPFDHALAPAGMPLFVLDVRSTRQARTLRPAVGTSLLDEALIHTDAEFARLRQWLRSAPADRVKLIATSVTVFPFARAALAGGAERIALDDWGGYPRSLHALLSLIIELNERNVVLLSGDRHLSSVSSLWLTGSDGAPLEVVSVVSSGSYAPWPFANQRAEELWLDGNFELSHQGRVIAGTVITAAHGSDDGFGLVRVQRQAGTGAWQLDAELDLRGQRLRCVRHLGDTNRQWQVSANAA